jgi:hypothetical protein
VIKRRPNHKLVKIHRNYKVEEVAILFGIHKNTVRTWIKIGLPLCDSKRPALILGRVLAQFLQTQKAKNKRTCKPDEMYCLRCREPQKPIVDMVDYQAITPKVGNLVALCSQCNALMNKRVSFSKLSLIEAQMGITFPQAQKHISDSNQPSLNSDFNRG